MKNSIWGFKNILCGILCALMVSGSCVIAAEPDNSAKDTETKKEYDYTDEYKKPPLRYDPKSEYPVYSGYTPDYSGYMSENYLMFMDILRLYTDTHLYEFTEDQVTEAFIMKLMAENPGLAKMFIDTLLGTMDEYSAYYEAGFGLASDGSAKAYGVTYSTQESSDIKLAGITRPGIYITGVIKGSNAEKAGLAFADRIVSVEGIPLEGLTLDAAGYLMKGLPVIPKEQFDEQGNSLGIPDEPEFIITDEEKGTKEYYLHIEIERNGEIIPIKMIKGRVVPSNITYSRAADKSYSYIKISSFSGDSDVEDFGAAVERAKKESNGNLIIDLRDNLGGRVDNAVAMANMLISEEGKILYYENSRKHDAPEPIYSCGGGYDFEKVTVLVNEYSASASELFAVIMRYNCGATIVGKTTYGKGVGQQGYSFPNGDMFTITSLEILDPLKRSYHNVGIAPDIEIDLCMKKEKIPTDLREFGLDDYASLAEGVESDAVMGLEQRLMILGYMTEQYVDGKYDSVTTAAIKAAELSFVAEMDGVLDESLVRNIVRVAERYKHRYYYFDSQMEVAEMTFKSNSQAKRRAKELQRESALVEKDKADYEKAEADRIKAEEKAEKKEAEQWRDDNKKEEQSPEQ